MPVGAVVTKGLADSLAGGLGEDNLLRQLLARLASEGVTNDLPSGAEVMVEGTVADGALVLTKGVLMTFKSLPGNRRQIADFAYAPALLLPSRFAAPWSFGVWTVSAAACCRVSQQRFQRVLRQDGRFYPLVLGLAQTALSEQQDLLLTLACRTPPERIASFLLRIARKGQTDSVLEGTVVLPMTRVQIADHLGLAPETVSRTFARLAADGLLSLPRPSRVVLHDPGALRALAEGRILA